jgi:hypothetical protein
MKISNIRLVSFLTAMTIVVLACVSAPASIYAQSQMTLKIPFDFYVGNQRFEPGDYAVLVFGAYVKISDGRGHSTFAFTNSVANPGWRSTSGGALVFTRYDNYYFLSEVRRSGYSSANGLMKAPMEIQIARSSAINEKIAYQSGH